MATKTKETKETKQATFQPRILVFACNWCSYAGADLAGVSRFQYPPNVKLIRLMCSGRVSPAFVIEAYKKGADGVMVTGCHIGDCHYTDGNVKCEEMVKKLREVLVILGIEPERFRLEWISASEGEKFARAMTEFTETVRKLGPLTTAAPSKPGPAPKIESIDLREVVRDTGVHQCIECGKCTGGCPMARFTPHVSPRLAMKNILVNYFSHQQPKKLLSMEEVWYCLTCETCFYHCPSGVDFARFIVWLRSQARKIGKPGLPTHGGIMHALMEFQTLGLKQNRLGWLEGAGEVTQDSDTVYYVGCLMHMEPVFSELGARPLEIARSTLKILNKLGIKPVVLAGEVCCGHDLYWTGDVHTFKKLGALNLKNLRKSGAKRVIFSCPECFYTYKMLYPRFFEDPKVEMVHLMQLLDDKLRKGELKLERLDGKFTFQDPCRLGRFLEIYDEPRRVMRSIKGFELSCMEEIRKESVCCGSTHWLGCSSYTKQLQKYRLDQATATGASTLITACPKCQIHLKCAAKDLNVQIEIKDFAEVILQAMNGGR